MVYKIMETPINELYSNLVIAPLYIIQLILCIVWMIYTRKEKGFIVLIGKIYSFVIVVNYLVAIYVYFLLKYLRGSYSSNGALIQEGINAHFIELIQLMEWFRVVEE